MKQQRLSPAPKHVVQTLVHALRQKNVFSGTTEARIQTLLELIDEQGYINYAQAYAKLFPQSVDNPGEKTKADKAFKKFRDTLAQKAHEHGKELQLMVDQNRNADAQTRHFWFAARDEAETRLTQYNQGVIQGSENAQEQSIQVGNYALSYLVVYHQDEKTDAQVLAEDLHRQFELAGMQWRKLDYHDIPIGETKKETRQNQTQQADFILFLLSPKLAAWLKKAQPFTDDRSLLPLMMRLVQPEQIADTVLSGKQIATDVDNKAWIERQNHKKEAWVDAVAVQIMRKVKTDRLNQDEWRHKKLQYLTKDPRQQGDAIPEQVMEHLIHCQGDKEEQQALPFLLDWLQQPQSSVICAIFGELGMGKTTLSQRLTRHLLQQHQDKPGEYPFPVYLDLRHVNSMNWDWEAGGLPELNAMLEHILNSAYNLPVGAQKPTVEDIQYLAQKQQGLIIFDGLDEVMNRLTPDQCSLFIQRLWGILPPIVWKPNNDGYAMQRPEGCGHLLMTCRSHFFQTLQDQINALSGRQREVVKANDYLWVTLLPFNGEQKETTPSTA